MCVFNKFVYRRSQLFSLWLIGRYSISFTASVSLDGTCIKLATMPALCDMGQLSDECVFVGDNKGDAHKTIWRSKNA
jgi:hypothetical protein